MISTDLVLRVLISFLLPFVFLNAFFYLVYIKYIYVYSLFTFVLYSIICVFLIKLRYKDTKNDVNKQAILLFKILKHIFFILFLVFLLLLSCIVLQIKIPYIYEYFI